MSSTVWYLNVSGVIGGSPNNNAAKLGANGFVRNVRFEIAAWQPLTGAKTWRRRERARNLNSTLAAKSPIEPGRARPSLMNSAA